LTAALLSGAALASTAGPARAAPPAGWISAGSRPTAYEMGVDRSVTHDGRPSAYVKAKQKDTGGFGTLMQMFAADDYRGKRLRFSAWVKSEAVDGWAGLWMRVDGKEKGTILAFDNMQNRAITGTTDWKRYEVVLDVKEEAAAVALGILLDQAGAVYMSGIKLEPVDTSVPVTDVKLQQARKPRNLEFTE
jgi:hypothetical protein